MTTIGRNDPCPCGSRKKYKKCCQLNDDKFESEYRRQRNTSENLVPMLIEFAATILKPGAAQDAWIDFNSDDELEPLADDNPMYEVFMPWFIFSWPFEPKDYLPEEALQPPPGEEGDEPIVATIAMLFLAMYHDKLPEDEREYLIAANLALFTICEILEVKQGVSVKVLDLFLDRELEVNERTASQTLERGMIVYCAPMTIRGYSTFLAMAPYSLRPTLKVNILTFRREILAEFDRQTFGEDELAEFDTEIRQEYLAMLETEMPPPTVLDKEGYELVPVTVNYELESSDEAYDKLKDLADPALEQMMEDSLTKEDGRIVTAEIPWAEVADDGTRGINGLLKIFSHHLQVDVLSRERAEQIKGIIEKRLGDSAQFISENVSPLDDQDWYDDTSGASDNN